MVYEITKEGLKKVDKIVNPEPDTEAPTQPQGLYASNLTSNSVELKWNPSTDNVGVKEYQVLRDGQLIQTVQGTTFTDQNLTVNKEYKYAVKAVDAAGNTSIQSEILLVKQKIKMYLMRNGIQRRHIQRAIKLNIKGQCMKRFKVIKEMGRIDICVIFMETNYNQITCKNQM